MIENLKENIKNLPFFFVVGRARSGTTLLRYLLEAHPNIIFPQEADFIITLANKYQKKTVWKEKHLMEFYNDVIHYPKFQFWHIDEEYLQKTLLKFKGNSTYADICKAVYYCFISNNPKKNILWLGDKNPVYSLHLKKLFILFPDSKFIHLCRDVRDNVVSMRKTRFECSFFPTLAYRWGYYVRKISRMQKKFPEKFFHLRYEDLVADTENKLKEICTFLQIPYSNKMPGYYENLRESIHTYPKELLEKYHVSLLEPLNTRQVEKWRNELTKKQIQFIELCAGRSIEKMGYKKENVKMPLYLYIYCLPGLLYGWMQFPVIRFINFLPFTVKTRMVNFVAAIFKQELNKFRKKPL